MGARPGDKRGTDWALLPAWLRHCGTMSAGTEQVLTERGQEEGMVEGMAKRREGDGSFIPVKSGRYLPRHTELLRV